MAINSRTKGKTGELELSKELTRLFGPECRRGQQFCGANGDADVVGLAGIHVEGKRTERLNAYKAIEQAVADAKPDCTPLVVTRSNRKPWLAIVRLDDLPELVKKLSQF
jgi:hypothetical protein